MNDGTALAAPGDSLSWLASLADSLGWLPYFVLMVLVAALGLCGLGIYVLYVAAEQAVDLIGPDRASLADSAGQETAHRAWGISWGRLVSFSYNCQDSAGILYGTGFILLVAAGASRVM